MSRRRPGCAVLVNTPAETAFARQVATELVGADQVTPQGPQLTGSEDFAFRLAQVPGSAGATEGANSHARSGPVLHTTFRRLESRHDRDAPKEQGQGERQASDARRRSPHLCLETSP